MTPSHSLHTSLNVSLVKSNYALSFLLASQGVKVSTG